MNRRSIHDSHLLSAMYLLESSHLVVARRHEQAEVLVELPVGLAHGAHVCVRLLLVWERRVKLTRYSVMRLLASLTPAT